MNLNMWIYTDNWDQEGKEEWRGDYHVLACIHEGLAVVRGFIKINCHNSILHLLATRGFWAVGGCRHLTERSEGESNPEPCWKPTDWVMNKTWAIQDDRQHDSEKLWVTFLFFISQFAVLRCLSWTHPCFYPLSFLLSRLLWSETHFLHV